MLLRMEETVRVNKFLCDQPCQYGIKLRRFEHCLLSLRDTNRPTHTKKACVYPRTFDRMWGVKGRVILFKPLLFRQLNPYGMHHVITNEAQVYEPWRYNNL
jgi:hypothetical protein